MGFENRCGFEFWPCGVQSVWLQATAVISFGSFICELGNNNFYLVGIGGVKEMEREEGSV